ncbi:MAG: type I-C CRISPR-associated endonuclease Cas1 [Desulfovibrionaceae bacterium]|nr:type I-C CRISPR-associated endonuclease Cas1 [Desulfovibrionaceae bacterium]
MKHLLNTLYVTSQGTYLAKEGEAVVVRNDGETRLRVPAHTLGGVVCFGQVSASPQLMAHCAENDIGMSFLSENGRFLARVVGEASGNVLLRRAQYRMADDPAACALVTRCVLTGKLANERSVLRRGLRDHGAEMDRAAVEGALAVIDGALRRLEGEGDMEVLRGLEGAAANAYFGVFDGLVRVAGEAFAFRGRNRRPPLDNINCLLSFLYTLLMHDVRSALETTGLDPAVGFLHRDRPGRMGLALDMMEEWRTLADRLALTLVNRRQVNAGGFETTASGAVRMDDETRKAVLVAYQKRKQEEVEHPFLGERMEIGLAVHVQAQLFARFVRGDLDGYPPFVWRS